MDALLSHRRLPMALPMSPPFLSIIYVVGIPRIPKGAANSLIESKSAVNVNLFFLKNLFTTKAGSFMLTAIMAKSLSLKCVYKVCINGISYRHSGHHVVQKFKKTILPLKSERLTILPFKSESLKSLGGGIWGM